MKQQYKTPVTALTQNNQHQEWLSSSTYPRISVVVPARNEARDLHYVLPYISEHVFEVILVDGHSTDNTIEVAKQLRPDIRVLRQIHHGKGDALRMGFAASRGDILVMLDADGSTDPKELPTFIEALLDGHDFAKGSRYIKGGGSDDITLVRNLGNHILSLLVNTLLGNNLGHGIVAGNNTNPAEAVQIVNAIHELVHAGSDLPSVGIVTFNEPQRQLIEDLLLSSADPQGR